MAATGPQAELHSASKGSVPSSRALSSDPPERFAKAWRVWRKKAGLRGFSGEPSADIAQCREPIAWCEAHGVALHYIQPRQPDQNANIERFNRSYRTEVLDAYACESLTQVRDLTDTWLDSYNRERPHDSLGRVPPLTFLPRPISQ